jgi:hypothetical protein
MVGRKLGISGRRGAIDGRRRHYNDAQRPWLVRSFCGVENERRVLESRCSCRVASVGADLTPQSKAF